MELKKVIGSYMKKSRTLIWTVLGSLCIFFIVFLLYGIALEPVLYGGILVLTVLAVILGAGIVREYRKDWELDQIQEMILEMPVEFPPAQDGTEEIYQEMVEKLSGGLSRLRQEYSKNQADLADYYTLWAHQIKTPIAAMRLVLQSENVDKSVLEIELFKVEQYVEMVLGYLRCESINADFSFQEYSLDDLVRQAVKKYKKMFILQKISLEYEPLGVQVLTDEKWLVFVLEQILSNGLKYTPKGKISIYLDGKRPKTLVIEDTGIGIAQGDIPRVFERGFTGENGRKDKRSTGIGLYLTKKITEKLSHDIWIESEPGIGTKVYLDLEQRELEILS